MVVALAIIGIIGAWVGYWIGHAFGWTVDAEFPLGFGAGARAIGLAIVVSLLSVMVALWSFVTRPFLRMRRVLASGVPGHATIRRMWRTGVRVSGAAGTRRQLGFELDVHPEVGLDYPAVALGMLSETEEAALGPGNEVTVRYDPADPGAVAVVGPLRPVA